MLDLFKKVFEVFEAKPSRVVLSRASILSAAAAAEGFEVAPVLQRYRSECGHDEATARRHWRELSRFLIMVGHLPRRGYGMFGPVDDLWHSFVLHTEAYQAFCRTQAGRFVHHQPGTTAKGSGWRSRYLQFLIDYRLIFGDAPPDDIWPLPRLRSLRLPATTAEIGYSHVKAMERIEHEIGRPGGPGLSEVDSPEVVGTLVSLGSGRAGGDGGGCGGGSG